MVFVTQLGGHNPNFVQWLAEGWVESGVSSSLYVVVAPEFPQSYPEIVEYVDQNASGAVRLVPLVKDDRRTTQTETYAVGRIVRRFPWLHRRTRLRFQRIQEWRLSQEYARRLDCAQCLFVNFDFYQSIAAIGARNGGRFSGIYHHLFFHYETLFHQRLTAKERARAASQRLQVRGVLRNISLDTLFLLDPFLADYLAAKYPSANIVHLPTPARNYTLSPQRAQELRAELAVDDGRKVFLLQGGISQRRGVLQVLDALRMLTDNVAACICLLLVGRHAAAIHTAIDRARESSSVQIISRDEFVPEADIPAYYQLADFILVTHPRHVGVSVSLAFAASAQKPVLASNFGFVGALVRRHRLGLAVDAANPIEIACGMQRLADDDFEGAFDPGTVERFAEQNTVERFSRVLIENMTRSLSPTASA